MRQFAASLANELQKQFSRKKTYVLLVITALIPIAAALIIAFFQGGLGVTPVRGMDFPIYILGIFTKLLLPLFIFMITADIFAAELSDHTIKTSLLRPVTRLGVYAAKISSTGLCILTFLLLIYVISVICSIFLGTGGAFFTAMLAAAGQFLAAFLPLLLLAIISSFISLLAGGSSGSIVLSLLVFIAAKTIGLILPGISGYLFTSYTDWYLLFGSGAASISKLAGVFMFIISYSIIFLGSGFLVFDRKEI